MFAEIVHWLCMTPAQRRAEAEFNKKLGQIVSSTLTTTALANERATQAVLNQTRSPERVRVTVVQHQHKALGR